MPAPLAILAIDSTLRRCSVALWKAGRIAAQLEELTPNRQAARLVPLIEQLLADTGTTYGDLTALACTTGPGSFTGIRIGLATAKAIALATKLPLAGVTVLEAVAWQAAQQSAEEDTTITTAMNAYRGEIYLQSFRWQQGRLSSLSEAAALSVPEVARAVPDNSLLAGDAPPLLAESVTREGKRFTVCEDSTYPTAQAVAELAAQRSSFTDHRTVTPLYIRAPDAKLPMAK